ncbi:uncharacterized protein LOC118433407 [Folsomia candida]|uniref:uncharacterized protein LOC118433407 n=1 Tax=Folsomia candida TaxID=158441 RepID=UPI001604B9D6|nr:uncharacterized protein LOC118433407 [Folsomia candida]
MDVELRFLGRDKKLRPRGQFTYCVLPYIEGQRYTFGHSYEDCRDGGEFFFLFRIRAFGAMVTSARFQISCRHGHYWIKRLSNGQDYAIFLNKTEVCDTTDGKKITLGDMLVLREDGTYPPPPWWKVLKWKVFSNQERKYSPENYQYKNVFRFQERCVTFTIPDPSRNHVFQMTKYFPRDKTESYPALENMLILSKIFSHMGLLTLKICRLVSSLWESEAVPWLKSRSQIRFGFYPYNEPAQHSARLFLYRHEMLHLAHPNWHVDCFVEETNVMFDKFRDDLDKVLENCHPIRRLSCDFRHINNELLIKVLNRVAGSLEELEVCFHSSDNAREDITEFLQLVEFPLLRRLEIDMSPNVSLTIKPIWYEKLAGSLIRLSGKVSTLYLKSFIAPLNTQFLREIMSNREYPRLREVRIGKIDSDGMEILRGLRANLVRLEIKWFSDECEIRQVEEVVQRQRESLEFLYLEVPPDWGVVPVGEMPYLKRKDILFRQL